MIAKARIVTVAALALLAAQLCAQSPTPPTNSAASKPPPATRGDELLLTGITDFPPLKRAYFQIDSPGQPSRFCTLAEGDQSGELALISIDGKKSKVTLRFHGQLRELSLNNRLRGQASPSGAEQQRDASHATHHRKRAELDRENEQRDEGEAPAKKAGDR